MTTYTTRSKAAVSRWPRPQGAAERICPVEAYQAQPRALQPGAEARAHFRLWDDVPDGEGAMTLRGAGRTRHAWPDPFPGRGRCRWPLRGGELELGD